MKTFRLRPPMYRAHQFLGLNDIDDLKMLAKVEDYTLTSDKNGDLSICIAHWHIPQGHWFIKEPSGIFRVMDEVAFRKDYEEVV